MTVNHYTAEYIYKRSVTAVAVVIMIMVAACQHFAMSQSIEDLVEYDLEIRENPFIADWGSNSAVETIDYSMYPYLKLNANHFDMNRSDFDRLKALFKSADDTVVSIVHIGDSHLQAEGATSRTRSLLQNKYGSSGRGLVTPFKMAGTNQPVDYTISSDSRFTTSMLLRKPWQTRMGFTGVAIRPNNEFYDLTISTKVVDGREQDFDCIRVFGYGQPPELLSAYEPGLGEVSFDTEIQGNILDIYLTEGASSVKLEFRSDGEYTFFGFALYNSMTGVEYHVIGNNGARYDCYTDVPNMGADVALLLPDLVIVSLGANEAFGKISDEAFYDNIDRLVTDIKRHSPQTQVLLVTPAECQRSVRVKKRRSFQINDNVARLRQVILRYGRDHNIPTYDWYEVAGGKGSSNHWIADGLLSKDRIHCTWPGYHLQGNLMYDALMDAIDYE